MGKADKNQAKDQLNKNQAQADTQYNQGINDTQNRTNDVTTRSDAERGSIWGGYNNLASDPNKGIDPNDRQMLLSGNYSSVGGGSGGGGGGGVPAGQPSYLSTFDELRGKTGGFDQARLDAINRATGALYDTSGNYGQTDTSIEGLQKFAATGGLSDAQLARINDPTLTEFSKTGGFNDQDLANIRNRGNSGIASTYANLQGNLDRAKLTSGQVGPGWSEAGFKLARQGAQDQNQAAVGTELGIKNAVNTNRLSAAGTLGQLGLGTAQLQSQNTLSGYGTSGNLANTKQSQIDAAKEAAASIDQNTQDLINRTRLGAASGESQDTLGRMSIGASSAAAQAALNAANERFLIGEGDQNRATGLAGMSDLYGKAPAELMGDQNLLLNYRNSQSDTNANYFNNRVAQGNMPGLGAQIKDGLSIAGQVAGAIGTGGASLALSPYLNKTQQQPSFGTYSRQPF